MVVAEERIEQHSVEVRCWGDSPAGRGTLLWADYLTVPGGTKAFLRPGSESAGGYPDQRQQEVAGSGGGDGRIRTAE